MAFSFDFRLSYPLSTVGHVAMACLSTSHLAARCRFSIPSHPLAGRSTSLRQVQRGSRLVFRSVAAAARVEIAQKDVLVDQLLRMVNDSDRGAALTKEQQSEVAQVVLQLEQLNIPPQPLKSPLIFGEWDVDYCSNPTAPGGYYRSAVGRILFRTKEMVQTLSTPDNVTNRVSFTALGLLTGEVSLVGKLAPLEGKWIEIEFQPPSLKLGSLGFQYGGTSKVKIAVLYVDERVRLGRGSRGSLFVFCRRQ